MHSGDEINITPEFFDANFFVRFLTGKETLLIECNWCSEEDNGSVFSTSAMGTSGSIRLEEGWVQRAAEHMAKQHPKRLL